MSRSCGPRRRSLVLAAVLAVAVSGCGAGGTTSDGVVPPATSAGTSPSPGPTTTPAATRTSAASLLPRLEPWFALVTAADRGLRAAARLVNGDVGTTTISPSRRAAAAVRALDVAPVAAGLPGGLPAPVERAALGLYAGLASRRAAFVRFAEVAGGGPVARTSPDGRDVLACLANGAAPARRFAADVAAARALAARTPDVAPAAARSRAAAEVAVRAAWVDGMDAGCDTCGGYAPRPFPDVAVRWGHVEGVTAYDGVVGLADGVPGDGIPFTATWTGRRWGVVLDAC